MRFISADNKVFHDETCETERGFAAGLISSQAIPAQQEVAVDTTGATV